MKVVLCTNHKGGVGKTELALHAAGIFRQELGRTLLIDCDGQFDAWKFHFQGDHPAYEGERRIVDDRLVVIWQPTVKCVGTRDSLSREFDYVVIDIESALEDTVQTLVQSYPDLVLIPVDDQHDALVNLQNPLAVIAALQLKAGAQVVTRIVPINVENARVQAIRERVASFPLVPQQLEVWRRIRPLANKANLARGRGKYVWNYSGCDDLEAYYRKLVSL